MGPRKKRATWLSLWFFFLYLAIMVVGCGGARQQVRYDGLAPTAAPSTVPSVKEVYDAVGWSQPQDWCRDGSMLFLSGVALDLQYEPLEADQVFRRDPITGLYERLTNFPSPARSATCSPVDPDQIIITTSNNGTENDEVWLWDDGNLRALTNNPEKIYAFSGWSPDGTRILVSTNEDDVKAYHVKVMDLATGSMTSIFARDKWNFGVGWSPDGKYAIVSRLESQEDSNIYLVDPMTGAATLVTPHDNPTLFTSPTVSRDGQMMYVCTNAGFNTTYLARIDLTDSTYPLTTLFQELNVEFEGYHLPQNGVWEDEEWMTLSWNRGGSRVVEIRNLRNGGDIHSPDLPPGLAGGFIESWDSRRFLFSYSGTHPRDAYLYDLETKGTDRFLNTSPRLDELVPRMNVELVHYTGYGGQLIPAFLYTPAGFQRDGTSKVILMVHGGPNGQHRPTHSVFIRYALAKGFAVLAPNVRGSTGYGKDWLDADNIEKRPVALTDTLLAWNFLVEQRIAHPKRIVIEGGSYGGFVAAYMATFYPGHWAAAVNAVGIVNFFTFFQNTRPDRVVYRTQEYGHPEEDRELLRQLSPYFKIFETGLCTSPMLILHGRNDPRVPVGEAEQIAQVLQDRGCPVELRINEDEGHGSAKRTNWVADDTLIFDFLDKYVQ
ncbi:S9 family peptidase [Candidatus Uhrbacteria bacterium]|nr:S9 family peptidase [Candidatus Uhrbacteria bacterium]